jgi:hypothetical protein
MGVPFLILDARGQVLLGLMPDQAAWLQAVDCFLADLVQMSLPIGSTPPIPRP